MYELTLNKHSYNLLLNCIQLKINNLMKLEYASYKTKFSSHGDEAIFRCKLHFRNRIICYLHFKFLIPHNGVIFLALKTEAVEDGISSGGVAGIVIGCVLALVALSIIIFILYKRYTL